MPKGTGQRPVWQAQLSSPRRSAGDTSAFSVYGGHEGPSSPPRAGESVQVAARIRPPTDEEGGKGSGNMCVRSSEATATVDIDDGRKYFFDHVFGPDATQEHIYLAATKPLLLHFLNGYNCTVLAYGQTGSGKTYTMGTDAEVLERHTSEQMGILPRMAEDLFAALADCEAAATAKIDRRGGKGAFSMDMQCQFLEIYNNEIRDLLKQSGSGERTARGRVGEVTLRENGSDIVVGGARKCEVQDVAQLMRLFHLGCSCRTTGATQMNERSSRSHAIFTLYLDHSSTDAAGLCTRLRSKFHLVDLAGSERQKKTGAQGKRFEESKKINMGLLALGNVISALGETRRKAGHVPYRESLITRLLQDSLGGNSKTLMIACCSSHARNRDETLNTLKYANRARNIKNAPIRVSALSMEEITALQRSLENMVHETLQYGSPEQSPEAIISRLDPASLFAAMVSIAQNLLSGGVDSALLPRSVPGAAIGVQHSLESAPVAELVTRSNTGSAVNSPATAEDARAAAMSTLSQAKSAMSAMEQPELATESHVKAMNNSLLVLQSEHAELDKCVGTTSTVLRDVSDVLRHNQLTAARTMALQKLHHICRSLDALAGLSMSQLIGPSDVELEYVDEVDMDRALVGFSPGLVGVTEEDVSREGAGSPVGVSGQTNEAQPGGCFFAKRSPPQKHAARSPRLRTQQQVVSPRKAGFWTRLLRSLKSGSSKKTKRRSGSTEFDTPAAYHTPVHRAHGAASRMLSPNVASALAASAHSEASFDRSLTPPQLPPRRAVAEERAGSHRQSSEGFAAATTSTSTAPPFQCASQPAREAAEPTPAPSSSSFFRDMSARRRFLPPSQGVAASDCLALHDVSVRLPQGDEALGSFVATTVDLYGDADAAAPTGRLPDAVPSLELKAAATASGAVAGDSRISPGRTRSERLERARQSDSSSEVRVRPERESRRARSNRRASTGTAAARRRARREAALRDELKGPTHSTLLAECEQLEELVRHI